MTVADFACRRQLQNRAPCVALCEAGQYNLFMYFVYILQSLKDGKLYIGYTADLNKRFREHQNGEVLSTKPRRPFELIFYEAYKSSKDAKRREGYFKTAKGKSTIRMMLQSFLSGE